MVTFVYFQGTISIISITLDESGERRRPFQRTRSHFVYTIDDDISEMSTWLSVQIRYVEGSGVAVPLFQRT